MDTNKENLLLNITMGIYLIGMIALFVSLFNLNGCSVPLSKEEKKQEICFCPPDLIPHPILPWERPSEEEDLPELA